MSQESNHPNGQPTDDIAEQLAQFDDSVQRGETPSISSGGNIAAEELKATILLLERYWPRTDSFAETSGRRKRLAI